MFVVGRAGLEALGMVEMGVIHDRFLPTPRPRVRVLDPLLHPDRHGGCVVHPSYYCSHRPR